MSDPARETTMQAVRAALSETMPLEASVAVVCRDDDELVELDDWSTDRIADGTALAGLERARRAGAHAVVLPADAQRWLSEYDELVVRLDTIGRVVHDDPACRIYGLPSTKGEHELVYWRQRKAVERELSNGHYRRFYTSHFGLDPEFYAGKRVLDIGCGPRGSLEWAAMAAQRVGLDPLAADYLELGAREHGMDYCAAGCEALPFADGHFDVVCSFNSLDHVDDIDRSIAEILRAIAPGGLLLLLTDVDHEPTPCEPVTFSWDIVERFSPPLRLVRSARYEKGGAGLYKSVDDALPYDKDDPGKRYGVLSAMFEREPA